MQGTSMADFTEAPGTVIPLLSALMGIAAQAYHKESIYVLYF
jgi:hypothetical protein